MDEKNQKDYEQDLALIRSLLLETAETPILEYWAFYIWGGLTFFATFLSAYLISVGWQAVHLFWSVWVPMTIVGSVGETWSWIVKSRKESLPLMSKIMSRFFLSEFGIVGVIFFLLLLLLSEGRGDLIIKLILPVVSIFFFLYSQITYHFVTWFGYAALLIGIFLLMLPFPVVLMGTISGVIASLMLLVAGIGGKLKERSK